MFNVRVTAPATHTLSSSRAEEGQDGTPCTYDGREWCGKGTRTRSSSEVGTQGYAHTTGAEEVSTSVEEVQDFSDPQTSSGTNESWEKYN